LKVLFIARASLYKNKGGDTIQILRTAESLTRLGIEVDVRLTDEAIDYRAYDLLHFFNIIRPADILKHVLVSAKPYVVSTIFVDYSEFDKRARSGMSRLIFAVLSRDGVEYLKAVARAVVNREKIVTPRFLFYGQRRSIKKIIRGAALLLPNSASEYQRLYRQYGEAQQYRVIPNSIDPAIFHLPATEASREPDLILCVARIEGLKNQLNLIRAVSGTSYRLMIIGAPSANQQHYYEACRKEAGPNVSFIPGMDQQSLAGYYARASIHVLPSWFETTGLSTLEAAAMGCRIVITEKGDQREYFGDHAFYCDPASPATILDAIRRAMAAHPDSALQQKIVSEYTWQRTAEKTAAAYAGIAALPASNL
jgi:glycosyltransferase involved in cell wall biosynthesis